MQDAGLIRAHGAAGAAGVALVLALALGGAPLAAQSAGDAAAFAGNTEVRHLVVAPAETLVVASTGAGAPVVLLPGPLGGRFGYRHVVSLIACAGRRAIVVDPLGFGWSPHPRHADYSLDAQADRVAAALDSLGVRQAVVGAHSMAASIALRLAYEHPDLVAAVVSLDGGPVEQPVTPGLRTAMRFAPLIKLFGAGHFVRGHVRSALRSHSADPSWVTDEVVNAYAAPITHDLSGVLAGLHAMERDTNRAPLLPNLSRIRVPVLLLIGGANRESGIGAQEVAELRGALPRFTVDTVPGSGIYLQEEQPVAVADALLGLVPAAEPPLARGAVAPGRGSAGCGGAPR